MARTISATDAKAKLSSWINWAVKNKKERETRFIGSDKTSSQTKTEGKKVRRFGKSSH